MTPKTHGPLFSATGMIGTASMQLHAHPGLAAPVRAQAAKVQRWADECAGVIVPIFTEASMRKMTKHGKTFVAACVQAGLAKPGDDEKTPMVAARLMAGHYVANYHRYRLKLTGRCWKYMDQTAGTLLAMLLDHGLGSYEERMFGVAEQMLLEVAR